MTRAQKLIGGALGGLLAPATFLGALLRGRRLLHPSGVVYRGEVAAIAAEGPLGELASRLTGDAIVRLSGALRSWPASRVGADLLGVALRLRGAVQDPTPKRLPGDQDLLFVSARSIFELLLALWLTDRRDFLNNRYGAILPYRLDGLGKVALRLVPEAPAPAGEDRRERLQRAVLRGEASLRLEARALPRGAWTPVVRVELVERIKGDPGALAFNPAAIGAGLVPVGVLQWTRPLLYQASAAGRRLAGALVGARTPSPKTPTSAKTSTSAKTPSSAKTTSTKTSPST